ncbi:MAG: hypothetical protein ACJ72N_21260 [Labedaea sp.]
MEQRLTDLERLSRAEHAFAVSGAEPAAVRLCLAVDIERYSRFTSTEAARAQARFVGILRFARACASIRDSDVAARDAGDAQFLVLASGLDESAVIPGLVTGLSEALRQTNADLTERARLRLRVAMHRGLLRPGANGWTGTAATAVHRLVDSAPVRAALIGEPAVDFALIVADALYRDVIAHGYPGLAPSWFQETVVDVPDKSFREPAWVYTEIRAHRGSQHLFPLEHSDRSRSA